MIDFATVTFSFGAGIYENHRYHPMNRAWAVRLVFTVFGCANAQRYDRSRNDPLDNLRRVFQKKRLLSAFISLSAFIPL